MLTCSLFYWYWRRCLAGWSVHSAAFSGNTICKNLSAITVNKFDLEFAVDPLFRKVTQSYLLLPSQLAIHVCAISSFRTLGRQPKGCCK